MTLGSAAAVPGTFTEAAEWLRDHAMRHYPSSQFAEQFAAR